MRRRLSNLYFRGRQLSPVKGKPWPGATYRRRRSIGLAIAAWLPWWARKLWMSLRRWWRALPDHGRKKKLRLVSRRVVRRGTGWVSVKRARR